MHSQRTKMNHINVEILYAHHFSCNADVSGNSKPLDVEKALTSLLQSGNN